VLGQQDPQVTLMRRRRRRRRQQQQGDTSVRHRPDTVGTADCKSTAVISGYITWHSHLVLFHKHLNAYLRQQCGRTEQNRHITSATDMSTGEITNNS